jgi:hypothetical protein
MDCDALILKNLDHLFELPSVDIAAPNALWLSPASIITSILLVIEPSERLWNRIFQKYFGGADNPHQPPAGMYDMDIVNQEFDNEMLILPPNYGLLDSPWEHDLNGGESWMKRNQDELRDIAFLVHFTTHNKPFAHSDFETAMKGMNPHPFYRQLWKTYFDFKEATCTP